MININNNTIEIPIYNNNELIDEETIRAELEADLNLLEENNYIEKLKECNRRTEVYLIKQGDKIKEHTILRTK